MDQETKRLVIVEHFENPYHKCTIEDESFFKSNTNSESCIDDIDIYLKLEDNIIKDLYFDGEACAITTSSASIMIKNLIGKSIPEAKEYIANVEKMVNHEPYNIDLIKEANVYDDIYLQQNRIKCCLVPYEGIKKIINKL